MTDDKLRELAQEQGTPFYAYDESAIRRAYTTLASALPKRFDILYSVKANPHPAVLSLMKEVGAGVDVASSEELKRVLKAGFLPEQISYVGPGKSPSELSEIVEQDLLSVVVESLAELDAVLEAARSRHRRVGICLRVNPRQQTTNTGLELIRHPSQFGIDEDLLPQAVQRLKDNPIVSRVGLHFYLHSQFLEAAYLLKNMSRFLQTAEQIQAVLSRPLDILNFGGGFGIPYFTEQRELNTAQLGLGLQSLLDSHRGRFADTTKFLVESGRFLVARSGVFVCRVLYRKPSGGITYLICDGGFAHHLAATGVGQVLRKNFAIDSIAMEGDRGPRAQEVVTIAGPSCYALDVLAQDANLPETQPGDLICIKNSGAYGYSFSPVNFLSPKPAREIFLKEQR